MYVVSKDFHGRTLSIETGRVAKQASGAALVRYGDTMILVTACVGAAKDGDFLPLTIDYVEKKYAAGKIPGGFFKREAKLSEHETLTSRLIDRPCRPLFPEGFTNEVQVVATVLSSDGENDADVLAVCGASAALTVSELPFEGPIAAVRVGLLGGKLVINPPASQHKDLDLNMVVAGTKEAIVMVEGGAKEIPEKDVMDALFYAHEELKQILAMQLELKSNCGKPVMEWTPRVIEPELVEKVKSFAEKNIGSALRIREKLARRDGLSKVKKDAIAKFAPEGTEDAEELTAKISKILEDITYHQLRNMVFDDKARIDGRDYRTVRDISIEVGFLPRTHGSSLFQRGETQAIVVATLGTGEDTQRLDNLTGEAERSFMLHYNFPPFSVGETKPMRGPGRREIGHGALAERAVKAIMPDGKAFPYVVRIVSEITESNGSSSMATVCGASLSLMDAGVPIKSPVAGIAMGLMKDGDKCAILTDILGDEDHLGDMDFKVCGTEKGITALQMDIKIKGLDRQIMTDAMTQAREGRLFVLKQMGLAIATPRTDLNKYAPRITSIKINPEKVREIIGPGGKTIRGIQESCKVKLEISDDGTVLIASNDAANSEAAMKIIKNMTAEAEIGKIYKGIVKRIADFGAFVEVFPGTDGLVHISQLAHERVRRVTDVVQEGDEVYVKVLDVDHQGKIRLSLKEAIDEMADGQQG